MLPNYFLVMPRRVSTVLYRKQSTHMWAGQLQTMQDIWWELLERSLPPKDITDTDDGY